VVPVNRKRWLALLSLLLLALVSLFLTGCGHRGDQPVEDKTTVTYIHDFSVMVPALIFWAVIGCAACLAALIWVPIQKWIPLAGMTFFGGCAAFAVLATELLPWVPWILGAGLLVGLLWLTPYLRALLLAVRRGWNEPEDAPNPAIIDKILPPKEPFHAG
jgi:hypothetical protein